MTSRSVEGFRTGRFDKSDQKSEGQAIEPRGTSTWQHLAIEMTRLRRRIGRQEGRKTGSSRCGCGDAKCLCQQIVGALVDGLTSCICSWHHEYARYASFIVFPKILATIKPMGFFLSRVPWRFSWANRALREI